MKRRQLMALAVVTGLLLVPLAASADSHEMGPKPLTWISYAMSQTGKGSALSQYIGEQGAKIYNPMMADGHILSWGVAMPVNHRPGDDWNVMEYVTFRDWAAVDAFMGRFMQTQMSKSPEEQKAEMEKWYSLIEAGSHYDTIYRHMIFEVGADMSPPAYFNLGYYDANPGQGEALMGQFKKYGKPVLGKLMEAGTIKSWGVAVPEVHGGAAGSHVMWWGMDSLAARDAVVAGMEAAAKERGEEGQKAAMKEWMAAVDMSAHHDRIMMVTYKGGAAPKGGEGEGGE